MLDILRAELERLFELRELQDICARQLEFAASEVQGLNARGAVADALVSQALRHDAVQALADLVVSARPGADKRLEELRRFGFAGDAALVAGSLVGPYSVQTPYGPTPISQVCSAMKAGEPVRLRVLSNASFVDPAALQRYLLASRLAGDLDEPGLPRNVRIVRTDSAVAVATDLPQGEPLSAQLGRPWKPRLAWPILQSMLQSLCALHAKRLVHGAVHPDNVLLRGKPGAYATTLVDLGVHHLRARSLMGGVASGGLGDGPLAYAAPEQLVGELPTARSDVYSFGLVLYALLAGRPGFAGTGRKLASARFCSTPEPLSFVAPRGWILPDLDELVIRLLEAEPERRPPDAETVLEMLEALAARSVRRDSAFPEETFDTKMLRLFDSPADELAAGLLEECIEQGASASRVAEAFVLAAEQLQADESTGAARRRLLTRAAALYDAADQPKAAAQAWRALLELDRHDEAVLVSVERAYRRTGDYQALVELLLEHAEHTRSGADKARNLAKVGELLCSKLDDPEQAMVAFVHAFLADPSEPAHARAVERLAGSDKKTWTEVLGICAREVTASRSAEQKNQQLIVMGAWYRDRLARLDVALQCFQAILLTDPTHDGALGATAELCRNAGQWRELSEILLVRAGAAPMPSAGRDLRAEAADVIARHLMDVPQAIGIYEQVLVEDPSHARSAHALCELYLRADRLVDYTRVMERRVELAAGPERRQVLFELAQTFEARNLGAKAVALYERLVREEPSDVESLRKLEEAYTAARRPEELLENLRRQLEHAVTPRQKASLLERIAALLLGEFLDRKAAAEALEQLLDIEPGHLQALQSLERAYRELSQWAPLAFTLERHAAHLQEPGSKADKLLELGALAAGELHETAFAIDAYERVRQLRPTCVEALEALATLRATEGDQAGAAEALEARASAEPEPERRAEYLIKAADILALRGDTARAIELFKQAAHAAPTHTRAALGLHTAYLARNEVELAVQALEAAIPRIDSPQRKASLSALLAETLAERTSQIARAQAAAAFAVEFDPGNVSALVLLAELERRAGQFKEARERFAAIESSIRELPLKPRALALCGHADCLARTGEPARALSMVREVLERAAEDRDVLLAASEVAFLAEDFALTAELSGRLVQQHGRSMPSARLADALWRRGESLRRQGQLDEAIAPLDRAATLDPAGTAPLRALVSIYRSREGWVDVSRTMIRLLARVQGDAKVDLLLEIGELAEGALNDRTTAGQSYLAALAARPSDRKILLKLARFYSAERDWTRLVEAVLKLVELTDDPAQKSKYLCTAARVALQEMSDQPRAAELLDQALQHDPSDVSLVAQAIELKTALGDHEGVEDIYRAQIALSGQRQDVARCQQLSRELAQLYLSQSNEQRAIEVLEASLKQGGIDPEREHMLLELYAKDPVRYLDRSVRFARAMVSRTPRHPEPYRILRRMYADARRRDATWVACQALSVLGAADTMEALYFKRYAGSGPMPAHVRLGEQDWGELVVHGEVDEELTRLFRLLQPVMARTRAKTLQELGLSESKALEPAACTGTLVQSLSLAARVLGVPMPLLFENPKAVNALNMTSCDRPVLLLAPSAVRDKLPAASAAFVAATHLTYLRPGFYVRAFVPKLALKAWLLAAMRVTAVPLPVDPEIEGLAREAQSILEANLTGSLRDHLAEPILELMRRGGKLSVSRWMDGVDLTSDRAGLVVCGELPAAVAVIQASGDGAGMMPGARRIGSLLQYSVSSEYLTLRDRLRLSVDWAHTEELPLQGARQPRPPVEG